MFRRGNGIRLAGSKQDDGLLFVSEQRRDRVGVAIGIEQARSIIGRFEINIRRGVSRIVLLETATVFFERVCPNVGWIVEHVL